MIEKEYSDEISLMLLFRCTHSLYKEGSRDAVAYEWRVRKVLELAFIWKWAVGARAYFVEAHHNQKAKKQ